MATCTIRSVTVVDYRGNVVLRSYGFLERIQANRRHGTLHQTQCSYCAPYSFLTPPLHQLAFSVVKRKGWRKAHPAGAHWIDWYDGRDCTEVMDAFHSEKARGMWQKLPKSSPEAVEILSKQVADDSSVQIAFRKLRDELEADGWWERDFVHEATLVGIWISLAVGAAATAHTAAPISTVLLALVMTNAGWLGHDYVHGVDSFCDTMRNFVCFGAGLGTTWWSDKHNKHHALTNEMGKYVHSKEVLC